MGRRPKWGVPIDGVLLLDKPAGMTSNHALQHCKHLLNAQKAGHTGALDPLATGLLPLCFGQATKISSYLLGWDKSYDVQVLLGSVTDTGDADGQILEKSAVDCGEGEIKSVLSQFIGVYDQVPPMYSALKVNGQPLYKLARQGKHIERKARRVHAYDIRFASFKNKVLRFTVDCSSGFYVRSLVEEVGEKLGCGAHVTALRRTRICDIDLADTISLVDFKALETDQARRACLLPTDQLITQFPEVGLDHQQAAAIQTGKKIKLDKEIACELTGIVRLYDEHAAFLGLGEIKQERLLAPKRLFIND